MTANGYVLGGEGSQNYTIGNITVSKANITPASLTVTNTEVKSKVYDGAISAEFSGTPTLPVSDADMAVSYSGGNVTNNYEFHYTNPAALTIQAVTASVDDYLITGNYSIKQADETLNRHKKRLRKDRQTVALEADFFLDVGR